MLAHARPELSMRSTTSTIFSLQILRFIAAFMVVCAHLDDRLLGFAERYSVNVVPTGMSGTFGVRIFFVISGFIMVWICMSQPARTPGAREFFLGRCIRIIPIYWLLTTVQMLYLVWATSIGDVTASSRVADWSSFLRSLFFIPYLNGVGTHRPVLAQGWTLNYEMFFYLVFALCLATAKKAAPLVCIGLMLALYGLGRAFVIPAPVGLLADDFLLSFAVGIAIGLVRLRVMPVVPRGAVIPGVVALVLLGNYGAGYITHGSTWQSVVAAVVVALCVFGREQPPGRVGKFFVDLGGASYSLYLVHGFVLLVASVAWRKVFGGDHLVAYYVIVALLSVLASVVLQRLVELPAQKWATKRLLGRFRTVPVPVPV
jgi:exopolysaccharide production protein ExoZ